MACEKGASDFYLGIMVPPNTLSQPKSRFSLETTENVTITVIPKYFPCIYFGVCNSQNNAIYMYI